MDPRATLPVVIRPSTLFKAAKVQNNRILPVAAFDGSRRLVATGPGKNAKKCTALDLGFRA